MIGAFPKKDEATFLVLIFKSNKDFIPINEVSLTLQWWSVLPFAKISEVAKQTTTAKPETLFIQELEPAVNVHVGSEKLMLY